MFIYFADVTISAEISRLHTGHLVYFFLLTRRNKETWLARRLHGEQWKYIIPCCSLQELSGFSDMLTNLQYITCCVSEDNCSDKCFLFSLLRNYFLFITVNFFPTMLLLNFLLVLQYILVYSLYIVYLFIYDSASKRRFTHTNI